MPRKFFIFEDDKKKLIELWNSSISIIQIGEKFQCSEGTILRFARSIGLVGRERRRTDIDTDRASIIYRVHKNGESIKSIANEYTVGANLISSRLRSWNASIKARRTPHRIMLESYLREIAGKGLEIHVPGKLCRSECMFWNGCLVGGGYGAIYIDGSLRKVHRLVGEAAISRSLSRWEIVAHICDKPSCYRLEHLALSTSQINTKDAFVKKRLIPPDPMLGQRAAAKVVAKKLKIYNMLKNSPNVKYSYNELLLLIKDE